MERLKALLDKGISTALISCIISNKKNKLSSIDKIKIRQVIIKGTPLCQITEYVGTKVLHQNQTFEETKSYITSKLLTDFKQCQLQCENFTGSVLVSSKGQFTIKEKAAAYTINTDALNHNRTKDYLLPEGTPVPFLVDLGIMNATGQIVKSKYDKFRQINRFLEFIRDCIPRLDKNRTINILDFGCGKSYLTFAMYYYLKEVNGFDLNITGLDLKADVIKTCNQLSKKYGYKNLHFLQGDVANYDGPEKIDMMVTLHACDTATDYALAKAVTQKADIILSVPCCQHELNKTISNDLLNPVLKYGLLKERTSALITDGLRASILEVSGYDTQILEFIDMEHTPKNLLIRGFRRNLNSSATSSIDECKKLMESLNISCTLYDLLKERGIID